MLQDSHIHIQDIKNVQAIRSLLEEAFAKDFGRFFNCAITPADWLSIKYYALQDRRIVPFFGFHPWFADLADNKAFEQLAEFLAWPQAFAGEMGLDRARKNIDFELQKEVFSRQLDLAQQYQRPFAVHCVRAWGEVLALIKEHAPGLKFLMHSFNGPLEVAREVAGLGGYFSISTRQLLKADDAFRAVFLELPADRILIETDFPYQVKWVVPHEYVAAVKQGYCNAAEWKGLPLEEFVSQVYANGTVFTDRTSDR